MNTLDSSTPTPDQESGTEARLLYGYKEARQLLGGVPQSTFAMWIAIGLVQPVRIGPRRSFIKHDDLMRLSSGAALPKAG